MDLIKNCHGCVRLRADPKRADRFLFTPKFGCDAPRGTRRPFMRPCPHFELCEEFRRPKDPPEGPVVLYANGEPVEILSPPEGPCYESMFDGCCTSLCAAPELPPQES